VKPQFEAGRAEAKGGVVRDPAVHRSVLERAVGVAGSVGLGAVDVIASPILGPEGNREFLLDLRRGEPSAADIDERVATVASAGRS